MGNDSEFSPTAKDLLNIDGLILEIKSKKNKLVKTKIGLQSKLSVLKLKYSDVEYQGEEFYRIKDERKDVKKAVANIDLKIKELNQELIFKNKLRNEVVFYLKEHKSLEGKEDLDRVVSKIMKLVDKYTQFAKDRTRIASLRIMANEFIEELEDSIKV